MRLRPPQDMKPYVKRRKNDQADAEAICQAVQRPTMRFVPIPSDGITTPETGSVHPIHAATQVGPA